MAFRWRVDDGPVLVLLGTILPSSTKKVVKFGPPLTKLSGSAHETIALRIWKSGIKKQQKKHHTQESQEVSPFPVGDHKIPYGVLGQVWHLIVSIPDIWLLPYFSYGRVCILIMYTSHNNCIVAR